MIYLIYILLLAASGAAGFWLGEDLIRTPLHVDSEIRSPITAGAFAVILLWGIFGATPAHAWIRILMTLSLLAAGIGGWFGGRHEATLAFNDCVERGEEVRQALRDYRKEHGSYPDSLDALAMQNLPGKRRLRGDLLQYIGSRNRYRLLFRDAFVTHTASEKLAFMAQK